MSYSPKISVIVPVYNAEHTIIETLDSIRTQTFTDFEVIIVNDGSTDNSLSILKDYISLDQRFQLITQNNAGVSVARNTGLDNVKGEWVCFIDSDDLISEDYLIKLYQSADKKSFICSNSIVEFRNKIDDINNNWDVNSYQANEVISYIINNKIGAYTWGKLYYANLLIMNTLRFNPHIHIGEDFEFNIRYAQSVYNIKLVSATYFYRVTSFSLSRKFNPSLVLARLKAAKIMIDSIYSNKVSLKEKDLLYINYGIIGSLRYVLKNKEYKSVCDIVKAADLKFIKLHYIFDVSSKWAVIYLFIYFMSKFARI